MYSLLQLTAILSLTISFTTSTPVPQAAASDLSGALPAPTDTSGEGDDFAFPLSNGFPNITNPSNALTAVEEAALGTIPNGPPPPSLEEDDLISLRLIAFNEIWEVAFFTELLYNVTNNVTGFEIDDSAERAKVIAAITAVQAQEQLHALQVNEALAHFNASPIEACRYSAPATDLSTAFDVARTFTDVVLGTLANVQTHLAMNDDDGLIATVGSIIGQEGEQNGFYRYKLDLVPSALPFLTASSRAFAFSALNQDFVVSGSCPNADTIDLPVFAALNVLTKNIQPEDQNLTFSFILNSSETTSSGNFSLVYINQQNTPIVQPLDLSTAASDNNVITFNVSLPYTENEMNGLTIAAVVDGSGPFENADAVANSTIAGPGLIEIL